MSRTSGGCRWPTRSAARSAGKIVHLRLVAQSVAADAGRREMYYGSIDGTGGMELLRKKELWELGSATAEEAILMLGAVKPPSGRVICITDPVCTGLAGP